MKIKNCKFINSFRMVSKEMTYAQCVERKAPNFVDSIEVVSVKGCGFLKIASKAMVKLIPLQNVTDIELDNDEQNSNAEGSNQGTGRTASAQNANSAVA